MKAVLLLWALVATVFAALGWTREPPATRSASVREVHPTDTRARRLRKQVDNLEAALAVALENDEAKPGRKDVTALMAESLALEGGDWNRKDAVRIEGDILRLIMMHPGAHRDLMALLETGPEQANDIQGYLLSNLAGVVRSTTVTAEIRAAARRLLVEGATVDQRDAAARILMGYAPPTHEDVTLALGRLNTELDEGVRDTLLEVLSVHGLAVGLTEEEAAPVLQRFREGIRSGELWRATALAYWSGTDADYDLVEAEFRSAKDDDARMELLNAFQPDTRMANAKAKALLLEVVTDKAYAEGVREMALDFLKGYGPWDRETAEAVRRAR